MNTWVLNRTVNRVGDKPLGLQHLPARKRLRPFTAAGRSVPQLDVRQPLQCKSRAAKPHLLLERPSADLPLAEFEPFYPRVDRAVEIIRPPHLFDLEGKSIEPELKKMPSRKAVASMDQKKAEILEDVTDSVNSLLTRADSHFSAWQVSLSQTPYQHSQAQRAFRLLKLGQRRELQCLISTYPELVNVVDSTGQTLLHWAAKKNDVRILRVLLDTGARVNAKDIAERTPLDLAKLFKQRDVLRVFSLSKLHYKVLE